MSKFTGPTKLQKIGEIGHSDLELSFFVHLKSYICRAFSPSYTYC